MAVGAPPNQSPMIETESQTVMPVWATFFMSIYDLLRGQGGPLRLAVYAKAKLPDAALWTGAMVYVSDETGGATLAFSDGVNWRRVQDRNIVS